MRTVLKFIIVASCLAVLSSAELLILKRFDQQEWSLMLQQYRHSPLLGVVLVNLSIPLVIVLYITSIAEIAGISLISGRIRNLRYGIQDIARSRTDGSSLGIRVVPFMVHLPPAPHSIPSLSLIREHPSFDSSHYSLKD
jgi:hypothetical protein